MSQKIPRLRGQRVGGAEPRQPWLPPSRPEWFTDDRRRCSMANPDWRQWTSDDKADLSVATRKCLEHCPFLAECRSWAIATKETHFAWGGMNLSKQADRNQAAAERELVAA